MHDVLALYQLRQIWGFIKEVGQYGIRISFCQFRANIDARPFVNMACREFNIFYEEHMYGCPMGLYANIVAYSQFGETLIFE